MSSTKEIEEYSLSDNDIKKYLPNAKIVLYNELKDYDNIEQLLPSDKTFFIVLYQDSEHSGHWCCCLRQKNLVEFYDPYGLKPDTELNWIKHGVRNSLGITDRFLTKMFDKTKLHVVYNDADYQELKRGVNTCGRHVVFRIKNIDKPLLKFHDYFKDQTKKLKMDYDGVVSTFIDIT